LNINYIQLLLGFLVDTVNPLPKLGMVFGTIDDDRCVEQSRRRYCISS